MFGEMTSLRKRPIALAAAMVLLGSVVQVMTMAPRASAEELAWAVGFGNSSNPVATADITVDGSSNVYVTGWYFGTVDFDPGPGTFNLTSEFAQDVFVQKLDASGNLAWAVGVGSDSSETGDGVAVDAAGNVYVTGDFSDTLDFDPGPGVFNLTGNGSIFVLKLSSAGEFVWAVAVGGGANIADYSDIGVDAAGNVYITGNFRGTVDFDPGPGTLNLTSNGETDVFVEKLDSSGNLVWARSMGGTDIDESGGIAVDASGNVHTTGDFSLTVDFDPGPGTSNLTSVAFLDAFVQKLDTSGDFQWVAAIGGLAAQVGYGVAVDAAGNVYTTGVFSDTVDFDPGPGTFNLTSNSFSDDVFVQKLDGSGTLVWATAVGGPSTDSGLSVAVDVGGSVYTTGDFVGTADFDPGAGTFNLTSASSSNDVFVQKLDPSGALDWAVGMGASDGDRGFGVAVDGSGNAYTTGEFAGTVDFDPGPGTHNLTNDGSGSFIQKLTAPPASTFYVSTTGDDTNNCTAVATPCATIGAAVAKAADGNTIMIATGIYTSADAQVLLVDRDLTFSGGWNPAFSVQGSASTIDAEHERTAVWINSGVTVSFDRVDVRNGWEFYPGIFNHGHLTMTSSSVYGNDKGGIDSSGGGAASLSLHEVSVRDNGYTGIRVSGGTATITSSTISGNTTCDASSCSSAGGGIANQGVVTLRNSTVSNNRAAAGAGIKNSPAAEMTIWNSTILDNEASRWPNAGMENDGTMTIGNSIVHGGTNDRGDGNCLGGGTMNSADYNLFGKSFCVFTVAGDHDLRNVVDPVLGILTNNGGPTKTHALLVGSPAIDGGNPGTPGTGGGTCEAVDQRGVARPQGARCDIGAFEGEVTADGSIRGTIRDDAGVPVEMGRVDLFDDTGAYLGVVLADADGVYDTGGLPAGTYWLLMYNGDDTHYIGYFPEWYNDAPLYRTDLATPIVVTAGPVSGVDVMLMPFFDDMWNTVFTDDIIWMQAIGASAGCDPSLYCVNDPIPREMMADQMAKALMLPPVPPDWDPFIDDDDSPYEDSIERFAGAGITFGCNPPDNTMFCPDRILNRGEMAAFFVRALDLTDDGGGDLFDDDDVSVFEGDIDRLATAGITYGCNPPNNTMFCPTRILTYGEIAAFLHRALGDGVLWPEDNSPTAAPERSLARKGA